MSDLSSLQPSIFFASCTLKGLVWLPWYFLPELFLTRDDMDDEDDPLLQDHHALFMERVCHYTNIFGLLGMISFYAVNPKLWHYRHYGWFLTALLLFQHIPQQLLHEGLIRYFTSSPTVIADEDDDYVLVVPANPITATVLDIRTTNRIFATIGVMIIQAYCVYYGHRSTLQRLAAEPLFVYTTLITLLLETHVTFLSVWLLPNSDHHVSHALGILPRQIICTLLVGIVLVATVWHRQVHAREAKLLRKQWKTANSTKPKMKFV